MPSAEITRLCKQDLYFLPTVRLTPSLNCLLKADPDLQQTEAIFGTHDPAPSISLVTSQ